LDTVAAESAGAASGREPEVEAGGIDGVDGDGVSTAEAAAIWSDGEVAASMVAALGQASTCGGGKGEVDSSGSVPSSAGDEESESGGICLVVPTVGAGAGDS